MQSIPIKNNVLIIEDDCHILENTAEILELAGYTVRKAENGKIGIDLALINKPAAVICDVLMPLMDGYRVLELFRQNPALSDVPFIFLSARSEPRDIKDALGRGADDYITKPFASKNLLRVLKNSITQKASRRFVN